MYLYVKIIILKKLVYKNYINYGIIFSDEINLQGKVKKKLDDFICKKVQKIIENIKNVMLYCC